MMKTTLFAILSFLGLTIQAQADAATKAREHMFKALTVADGIYIEDVNKNISHSPWEALAYMEEGSMSSLDDLNEAVPDYYHFQNNLLQLKLIDAQNSGGFGKELIIPFKINGGETILLINPKSNRVEDSWDILYLDNNYLALDMGDIRVFFIHTIIK